MRFPVVPPNAKQTNCWRFVVILGSLGYLIGIVSVIAMAATFPNQASKTHDNDSVSRNHDHPMNKHFHAFFMFRVVFGQIIEWIIFLIAMYHTQYTKLSVKEYDLEITMGPLRWCILDWIFSSQVRKDEIYAIERKQRHWFLDIVLRNYCYPINWCMCHKSYSSYFFPLCCDGINVCNLCEGDSPTHDMIQINLTEDSCSFGPMCCKRCAPCAHSNPFTCFVYNRIALSLKDESSLELLRNYGYPLKEYLIVGQPNPIVPVSAPTIVEEPKEVLI